jgi:hypothetical protein
MPQDKPGRWVAVAIRTTEFTRKEIDTEEVEGYQNAYIRARYLALALDVRTPNNGYYGIEWAIRKVQDNE